MIIGIDNIIEVLQFNAACKWQLKRSEKSAPIFKFEGEHSTEEAVASFNKVYEKIEPGLYFLECWNGDDKRYRQKTPFRKEGSNGSESNPNIAGVEIGSFEEVGAQAVNKYLQTQHYKNLEEENKDLKSTQDNFFFKLGSILEPHLPDLIGAITKTINPSYVGNTQQKKQFSQRTKPMPEKNEKLTDKEITEKVSTLFSEWISKDPQALELIEKIVLLMESNPQMYETAKNLLINS